MVSRIYRLFGLFALKELRYVLFSFFIYNMTLKVVYYLIVNLFFNKYFMCLIYFQKNEYLTFL